MSIERALNAWEALAQAAPEVAAAANFPFRPSIRYDDYPGFRMWIIAEFALNTSTKVIKEKLAEIREYQMNEGQMQWPLLSRVTIEALRRDTNPTWAPLRAKIEDQIVQVGVVAKNTRLASLQQTAQKLEEEMWEERDAKNGRLYLLSDYRAILEQIAKEMGELGIPVEDGNNALANIAQGLVDVLRVRGLGLQETQEAHDYGETPVRSEGADLQADEVPAPPSAD